MGDKYNTDIAAWERLTASVKPDPWTEDKDYPVSDWQDEVRANDTRLGYLEWIEHRRESEANG